MSTVNDLLKSVASRLSAAMDIEKAKGEGSRGGKVIGHTKSGKPIYDKFSHPSHSSFTQADHKDAGKAQFEKVKHKDTSIADSKKFSEEGAKHEKAGENKYGITASKEKIKHHVGDHKSLVDLAEHVKKVHGIKGLGLDGDTVTTKHGDFRMTSREDKKGMISHSGDHGLKHITLEQAKKLHSGVDKKPARSTGADKKGLKIDEHIPKGYKTYTGEVLSDQSVEAYNRATDKINQYKKAGKKVPENILNGRHNLFVGASMKDAKKSQHGKTKKSDDETMDLNKGADMNSNILLKRLAKRISKGIEYLEMDIAKGKIEEKEEEQEHLNGMRHHISNARWKNRRIEEHKTTGKEIEGIKAGRDKHIEHAKKHAKKLGISEKEVMEKLEGDGGYVQMKQTHFNGHYTDKDLEKAAMDLNKALFNDCETIKASEEDKTKKDIGRDIKWKVENLKSIRDLSWLIQSELPELKELFEKQYSSKKAEIKKLYESYKTAKKSDDGDDMDLIKSTMKL